MPRNCRLMSLTLLLAFLLAISCPAQAAEPESDPGSQPTDAPGYSMDDLRKLADRVQRTGINPDRIPSLYKPGFVSISDASLSMDDDEIVFVVQYPNNRVRIYPQRIMVWHEVVNDVLPDANGNMPIPGESGASGDTYTITYCPLTGSVTAFRSMAGKYPSTFGVTGNLLNGNTVLYDRVSQSLWCQLMGVCIEGPFRGKRLDRLPVLWARWGGVKERYAGIGEVLSRSTGFSRPYGKDPYGNYHVKGSYYDDVRLLFALSFLDSRLPPKKRILGIEADVNYGAVQVDSVREARVLNFTLGITPMVAMYDTELDAVRIFDRRMPGMDKPLTFIIFEDRIVDEQTRSDWTPLGSSTYGRLREKQLAPVLSIDSMWFAWASFHKGSQIFPFDEWK